MIKRFSLATVVLILFGGCSQKASKPAHLQFISMIPVVDEAEIEIMPAQSNSESGKTFLLGYGEPSGYNTFEPGKYNITYNIDSTTLLQHTFVLGKESYQTLIATGMLPDSVYKNPHTTTHTIKNILGGSESFDENGYMPQFFMLRDLYRGKKQEGMIRPVNSSPFVKKVIIKDGDNKLKTLLYPKHGEPLPVQPGNHTFNFFLGSVKLAQKEIPIEEGYIYTVITGNASSSNQALKVVSYKTASEVIRK